MSRRESGLHPGLTALQEAAQAALSPGPPSPRRELSPTGPAAPAHDGPRDEAPADGAPAPPEGDAAASLALVQRAQEGDAEAFGLLYDRYVEMVYRYVRYRVASPQLAEDLTSETFLRALRRLGGFRWQGRDVGAWFVTIARNLIADHYKSSRYRLELPTGDVAASGGHPDAESPEAAVLAAADTATLLAAVRRLRSDQQECVSLRFLQGLSVAETAEVMGRTDGAVKALQHRAVRNLAAMLPDEEVR